jgi:hypothetical protein
MVSWSLSVMLLCQIPAPTRPVAMVLVVSGGVIVQRPAVANRPAQVMDMLYDEDRLATAEGGRTQLVFLQDGHREITKPSSAVVVKRRGCEPASSVDRQPPPTTTKKAVLEGLQELGNSSRGATVVFRSDPGAKPQAVRPITGTAVLSDRPDFSWPASEGANRYEIALFRSGSNENVFRTESKTASLKFPDDAKSLTRSRKYHWQVSVKTDATIGRNLLTSSFTVAGPDEIEELRSLEPLVASADPADWLLAAATYASYGADAEALALYDRLAEADPKVAGFHAARAVHLERSGRTSEAQTARQLAESLGYVVPRQSAATEDFKPK